MIPISSANGVSARKEMKIMIKEESMTTIQNEDGKWVPAEPIPYYPPKKRSFKEIVVSTIRILLGKDGGQDDA